MLPLGRGQSDYRSIFRINSIEICWIKVHANFGNLRPFGFRQEAIEMISISFSFVPTATRVLTLSQTSPGFHVSVVQVF